MKESQKLYLITIETQEPGLMINWLYTHRFTYQIIYEPSTQIGIDITGMDDPRKGKNNGHSRKDVDGLERHYCGLELWLGTQQASDDTGDKPKDKLQRVSGSIHPFLGDSEFAILPEESVEILEAYLAGTIQPIRDEEDLKTPGHVSYKRSYVCDFKVKELTDKNHLKYEKIMERMRDYRQCKESLKDILAEVVSRKNEENADNKRKSYCESLQEGTRITPFRYEPVLRYLDSAIKWAKHASLTERVRELQGKKMEVISELRKNQEKE